MAIDLTHNTAVVTLAAKTREFVLRDGFRMTS